MPTISLTAPVTAQNAPEIVVATEPTELIVSEGEPNFEPLVDDLLVLVGVHADDDEAIARRQLERLLNYRVFSDDAGRMNLSLLDVDGGQEREHGERGELGEDPGDEERGHRRGRIDRRCSGGWPRPVQRWLGRLTGGAGHVGRGYWCVAPRRGRPRRRALM